MDDETVTLTPLDLCEGCGLDAAVLLCTSCGAVLCDVCAFDHECADDDDCSFEPLRSHEEELAMLETWNANVAAMARGSDGDA